MSSGSLNSELSRVLGRPEVKTTTKKKNYRGVSSLLVDPSLWDPAENGITHINIGFYTREQVEENPNLKLGAFFNFDRNINFVHPVLGTTFRSFESFYNYVCAIVPDPRLRAMRRIDARNLLKELGSQYGNQETGYLGTKFHPNERVSVMLLDTVFQVYYNNDDLVRELLATDLEFDMYYRHRDSGKLERAKSAFLRITILDEVRRAIRAGDAAPNYRRFNSDEPVDVENIYTALKDRIRAYSAEQVEIKRKEREERYAADNAAKPSLDDLVASVSAGVSVAEPTEVAVESTEDAPIAEVVNTVVEVAPETPQPVAETPEPTGANDVGE
jgi:hypothetical protein